MVALDNRGAVCASECVPLSPGFVPHWKEPQVHTAEIRRDVSHFHCICQVVQTILSRSSFSCPCCPERDVCCILCFVCCLCSLVRHMESEDFLKLEDLSCCVLRNFRGMLENPPELNQSVRGPCLHTHARMHAHTHTHTWVGQRELLFHLFRGILT